MIHIVIEACQSPVNWEGYIGNNVGLEVEVAKKLSEGDI